MPINWTHKALRPAVVGKLLGGVSLWLGLMCAAAASEAPPPAAEVVQDQLKNESVGERVMPDARDWKLDASVFTELKPFTAPEQAIKLPEDQQE